MYNELISLAIGLIALIGGALAFAFIALLVIGICKVIDKLNDL